MCCVSGQQLICISDGEQEALCCHGDTELQLGVQQWHRFGFKSGEGHAELKQKLRKSCYEID